MDAGLPTHAPFSYKYDNVERHLTSSFRVAATIGLPPWAVNLQKARRVNKMSRARVSAQ
ncbi:hypothetical protein HKCCE4037_16765 [Rhodobacterales bacterium HKCCE4037]|nr:hypothetical protein [Rhodobacterales bacterium HKCCE4037]